MISICLVFIIGPNSVLFRKNMGSTCKNYVQNSIKIRFKPSLSKNLLMIK